MNNFAVVLTTCNRYLKLKACMDALITAINFYGKPINIFIFVDKYEGSNDEFREGNRLIKDYLNRIAKDNNSIHLVFRNRNYGPEINMFDAQDQLFFEHDYEYLLTLEDDVILAKKAIILFKENLISFAENKNAFSFCLYAPPFFNSSESYFVSSVRFCGWAPIIKKQSWVEARFLLSLHDIKYLLQSKSDLKALLKTSGPDIIEKIFFSIRHQRLHADIAFTIFCFFSNKYNVYPSSSYAQNIGFDGTGTNSDISDKMNVNLSNELPTYTCSKMNYDYYEENVYKFRSGSIKHRMFRKFLKIYLIYFYARII